MMKKPVIRLMAFSLIVIMIAAFSWQWWQSQQTLLPADIATGNGRIEADQIDITTKYAGRVKHILVQEGDLVTLDQVLANMDTTELDAQLAQTQAQVLQTRAAVVESSVLIAQRESELTLAELEFKRVAALVKTGAISQSLADQKQTIKATAIAVYNAAKAHVNTLEQSVLVAQAEVKRVQTQIDEAVLKSPAMGRVLYRLAQPNEVLGSGGKVLTIINLADIYMEVFLPSAQAYLTPIGAQARVKLDILDIAIPAQVSFVSPESQFTPKQVETQSERDKLMFRVKLRIPQALVLNHIEQVKTGVRGVAYIRLSATKGKQASAWPVFLQKLPDDINPAEQSSQ
ncbi:HlyD family secretion protein [Colwellia sp. MB02u-9]|uniref:HlyD family secretion protein n=1 Tax=Colwellia sp. MB02u-9 TaxID=2759823 RepID=UPI0021755D0C|nr:HlyD family efflux transporter periplasmic adaptor subunit [Colwellia sp. MB02u-9]